MAKGSDTRSSLLWEVERILKETEYLPQVLLMENVPQVHSKKNIDDFKAWIAILSNLGYKSYYQDLNAKDFGIPQNRNRCFMISLLGDYDFVFPKPFELKTRLKDLLEDEVDEKFYLSDKQVESIKRSSYHQNQKRIQEKEYCDTLCARDFKDPKCVRVGGLYDSDKGTHQAGSIYDGNGLSPTLSTMQGGNRQPFIEIKNNTKKGYLEANDGDGCYITNIDKKRGTVQKDMIPTIKTNLDVGVVVNAKKKTM